MRLLRLIRFSSSPFAPTHARGNVFALLFGAVALTGVLAAVGMQTLTGPVTTITRVTQKNIADTQLLMNAKIIINAAVSGASGGDSDGDGLIEPAAFIPAAGGETPPVNGGYLPTDLGLSLTDPWGTKYGYCVWDHGSINNSTNRITGDNTASASTQPVIAIIAAGPDKVFQTTCAQFSAGTIDVTKAGGSDDLIFKYTYAEASANSNGLWSLNLTDTTKAELRDSAGSAVNVTIDRDTGIGDFIGLTTDTIAAKTDIVSMDGGLKLDNDTNVTACGSAQAGTLRFNTTDLVLEVCDGNNLWKPAGSDVWQRDGTNVYLKEAGDSVGIGTDAPTEKLDVQGNTNVSGNIGIGGAGTITGDLTVATDALFVDSDAKRVGIGTAAPTEALDVAGNAYVSGGGVIGGNLNVDGGTLYVDAGSNRVGIGTTSPDAVFNLVGSSDMGPLGSLNTGNAVAHIFDGTSNMYMDGRAIISDTGMILGTNGTSSLQLITNELTRISIASDGTTTITASAYINGTLGVNGATTLNNTLTVTGNTAIDVDTFFVDVLNDTVGIGTAAPQAKLDVLGGVKIGLHGACNVNGVIQYEPSVKKMQLCVDGTWSSVSSIDKLDDIGDVDVPSPNPNDVLTWDSSLGRWVAKNIIDVGPAAVNPAGVTGSVQFKTNADLDADPDYFHYDKANHRLGVGNNNPSQTLDVTGTANVSGNTTIGGMLDVTGATTLASTLNVIGSATFDTSTLFVNAVGHNVGIGTILPDPSALLDLSSTTGGFLTPRLSTTQRNAISNPATGLIIFNNTTNKLQIYDGLDWLNVGVASGLGSSMIDGWPDAINCGAVGQPTIYYLTYAPFSDGKFYYRNIYHDGDRSVWFNADKTYDGRTTAELGCTPKSINQLYAENRAYNFVGGSSAGEGGSMVTDVPDAIDCGVSGTQRFLFLQTATATSYTYSFSGGANGIGMQVVFSALPSGNHTSTTNTAGWTNANGCDSKTLSQLASEDRVFYMVGSAGAGGGGSTVTAAGADGYIQFNSAGVLDAESTLYWDRANDRLSIGVGAAPVAAIDVAGGVRLGTDGVCDSSKLGMIAYNGGQFRLCTGSGSFVTILDSTFTEQDPKVGTLNNTKWCATDGTRVICDRDEPVLVEQDPKVGTLDSGKWCTSNGTTITCTADEPVTTAGSDKQVIFNDGGVLTGENDFTWDKTTNYLDLGANSTVAATGVQLKVIASADPPIAGPNSAGGSSNQVQFNVAGTLQGDAGLIWDNSNKRLGISTASPLDKLHITGGGILVDSPAGDGSALKITERGTGFGAKLVWLDENQAFSVAITKRHDDSLAFYTGGLHHSGTEKMVLTTTGHVGIGTASPSEKLTIDGVGHIASFGNAALSDQYISVRGGVGLMMGVDADLPNASGSALIQAGTSKGMGFSVNNPTFGAAPSMFITSGGSVGIGTTNPGRKLTLADPTPVLRLQDSDNADATAAAGYVEFVTSNGTRIGYVGDGSAGSSNMQLAADLGGVAIYAGSNYCSYSSGTSWSCSSDMRLKKDIQPLAGSLERILRLQGVSYRWIDPNKGEELHLGLVAQEVEAVYSELVSENEDGFKTVEYAALVSPLIEAVKELKALFDGLVEKVTQIFDMVTKLVEENRALKAKIEFLEGQNADILKRLESLEAGQ